MPGRLRTVLVVGSVAVCALGATAASQQRGRLATRQPPSIVATTLSVNRMVGGGTEFQDWQSSVSITGPSFLSFRWTTKAAGAVSARWVVTDLPFGRAGARTVKSGPLPSVPGPGQAGAFSINFTEFIPATPPKKPYVLSYYVYVILTNASKQDLAPSNAVTVRYGEPGEQTQFDEDMGQATNQSLVDALKIAREALKVQYGLYNPVGDVQTGPGIGAFQRFKNAFGEADASIEVSGSGSSPTIYVGVPRKSPFGGGRFIYQWYRYTVKNKSVLGNAEVGSEIPGVAAPVLPNPAAWSKYSTYNGIPGDDPPHWSPVLVASDQIKIAKLHNDFQYPGAHEKTRAWIENFGKGMAAVDLTERAKKQWQSVKLNGFVEDAWYTSGDYGLDHNEDYHDGEDAPTGHMHEETDITWAGLDWDMTVIPDPSYNYLASTVRPTVRVEMENFALMRKSYWPQTYDWLQAIGRWVVDCGHTSYTEIHPPEVLVATTQNLYNPTATRARVTVTGAYLGNTVGFVVNPPPRPSATSKMYWRFVRENGAPGFDRKDNIDLLVEERGTLGNPNHLYVKVVPTAHFPVIRRNNGRVCYTRDRRAQVVIECGWEGIATGTVRVGAGASKEVGYPHTMPVKGASLFFRSADVPGAAWQAVTLREGDYISMPLPIGPSFWLRPAGSGWNFAQPSLGDPAVPYRLTLKQDEVRTLLFGALPDRADVQAGSLGAFAHYGRKLGSIESTVAAPRPVAPRLAAARPGAARPGAAGPVAAGPGVATSEAANQALYSALIALDEAGGELGVKGNNLGYRESTNAFFRLKSLLGEDGLPIKDQASAVIVDSSTNPPSIALRGTPGDGVPGARVRARLLLGNDAVGFRVAGQADVVTGYQGLAHFRIDAGTHVENATIAIEVLENPANPWFLPKIRGSSFLFYPGDGTANAQDSAPGRIPYSIKGITLQPGDITALLAARDGDAETRHFIGEIQEKVSLEQGIRKRFGLGTARAVTARMKKLESRQK